MVIQKINTSIIKQNIGIDIAKDDFKVCLFFAEDNGRQFIKGSRTFKNTLTGFESFWKWLTKKSVTNLPLRITLEATGVYYENLSYFLYAKDCYVSVVLPNQSKAYAKSLNLKSKTDKIDAKMLGQLGIERNLSQWHPISDNLRILKQLTRDRLSLVEEKTALSNKSHALDHSYQSNLRVQQRLQQRIDLISQQTVEVEQEIAQAVETDSVLKEKVKRICKVKGFGLITVAVIIAETNGFALFTSRAQLISYAGYDIVEYQSGSSINGKTRISKKGNRHIRRALHFPAITMVKYEPHFKQIFERVLKRTAIKMKAYVAIQRKALVLIYTLFKNDTEYDPNYNNQLLKETVKQLQA